MRSAEAVDALAWRVVNRLDVAPDGARRYVMIRAVPLGSYVQTVEVSPAELRLPGGRLDLALRLVRARRQLAAVVADLRSANNG